MAHRQRLQVGNGGWVRLQSSATPVVVYVRYSFENGQLRPAELYLETLDGALSTDALRDVQLGQLDAWVNTPVQSQMVRSRIDLPGPDLCRPARSLNVGGLGETPDGELVRRHWLDDMYWAQIRDSGVPQPKLPVLKQLDEMPDEELQAQHDAVFAMAKLDVPASRPFGDDFYRSVAAAYSALSEWTTKPAAVIADKTRVDVVRVHKWIRVARQRGFLGAGRRGKVG